MPGLVEQQTAIVALPDGTLGLQKNVDIPALEDDMILVKNMAVALNPIDTKMVGKLAVTGAIAGMDFAGEVVAIGPKAKTSVPLKPGDRVCGAVPGMHELAPSVGAFAQYVGATDLTTLKVPDHMSIEEAATLGSGIGTIGLALFKSLDVPGYPSAPATKSVDVLVYGGSSATGTLAIQFLKLSGLNPITTCSPSNFDLVKSYGASAAFNYRDEDCIEQIRKHTRSSLKYVLDCIAEPETMQFCFKCLGRTGGKYTALEPFPDFLHNRPKTVTADWVLGPRILGKTLGWPEPFGGEGDPENRKFGFEWFALVQELLDTGKLKTHPHKNVGDNLGATLKGLELLRKKQVSGQKLVCLV